MASKRTSQEEGQGNDDKDLQVPSKRKHGNPPEEQKETRHLSFLTAANTNAVNEIALCLKPVIREVILEVIPPMLQRYLSPCGLFSLDQQTCKFGGRALQLCFMNKLPQPFFTQLKITAEGDVPLQVELRDAALQQSIVRDEKIRICVLDGDFGSNGNEDWTAEEFNAHTLSPRGGKGALLNGDTVITLKNGVGYITNNIVFTDNSSWTKSKTFRLGVKIVQSNSIGAEIREGRSEPFKVLDYRGQAYKKHECPSLNDEVWRLKKIGKGGELLKQLLSHGIKNVKDFLQLLTTNPTLLREIMGNIPRKSRDTIIAHAKSCVVDDYQLYIYHSAEQSIFLVLNCIYEVVGVTYDRQNYRSIQSVNSEEKCLVEIVKQQAYNNLKDLMPLETTIHGLVNTLTGVQTAQYDQGLHQFDIPIVQQDFLSSAGQPGTWASSSALVIDGATQIDQLPVLEEMPQNWSASTYIDDGRWDQFESHFPTPNQWPFSFAYGDGTGSSNHSFVPNSAENIPSKGRSKKVWHKIRNAFKWVILHIAKRNAKLFPHHY